MSVSTLTNIIDRLIPEPHAGLLAGILFGTKETLPSDLYQNLVTTGTLHIIALSGMNISIIVSFVSNSLLRFVSRRIASLLTIVLIIGFILFVGPSPSIVRAGIMGSMTLVAVWSGRQSWGLYSLFFTGFAMILVHVPWATDISFQLSFLATLGMILFGQNKQLGTINEKTKVTVNNSTNLFLFDPWIRTVRSFVQDELRTTLSAQVFTIPLVLFYFHRISLVSPLTNVAIAWAIPYITIFGFITVILGLVALPLAYPVAWVCWLFLDVVIKIINATSSIPFSSINLKP